MAQELSQLQKDYRKFFADMLKKFNAESPADLTDEQKSEFFDAINKWWENGKGPKKDPKSIDVKTESLTQKIKEQYLGESPVGQRGRTSREEALRYINDNPEKIKELKKFVKEVGGKEVFRQIVKIEFDKELDKERLSQNDVELMKKHKIEKILRGNFVS